MTLEQALEEIEILKETNARLQNMLGVSLRGWERLPLGKIDRIILGLLIKTGEAPNERLHELIWGDRVEGEPEWANSTIKVTIVRLRKKLVPLGVTIRTIYGHGYVMSKEDRNKLTKGVDLDSKFDAVRKHAGIKLERPAVVTRPKTAVPMSDRPKGKWAW